MSALSIALQLWLAQAGGYAKLESLKTPEWLAFSSVSPDSTKLSEPRRSPPGDAVYEKLSLLKAY